MDESPNFQPHFPDLLLQDAVVQAAGFGIQLTYAVPDDSYISGGLRHLTKLLAKSGLDTSYGLGGEYGYGCEYENDVFEMHPFWWGDCQCGFEQRDWEWSDAHDHAESCYQSELDRRGGYDHAEELAKEWGLPYLGCAVHCTCGHREAYRSWRKENDHDLRCPVVRPNFRHKPSGSEVRWYKYVGRDNEIKLCAEWHDIMTECVESIRV